MNKASGGDGIPVELFQILKMMLWKCCTQCASKFGKLSSGHRTGKGQFYSNSKERQCQKMLKLQHNFTHLTGLQNNAQNSPSRASNYVNRELPDVQAGFRKGRGTRDQIVNFHWITEKAREFQKNVYFCFTDYSKALTVWITINCGKFVKRWEYQTTLSTSWEICMQVKEQQLELNMEQKLVPIWERSM